MVMLSLLFAALAFADGSVQLAIVIISLGAFSYSLHSIFISAAIGVAGEAAQCRMGRGNARARDGHVRSRRIIRRHS
jgi:hypothetical protein